MKRQRDRVTDVPSRGHSTPPSLDPCLPLGITMGDPAGIGPEVILKSLARTNQRSETRHQKPEIRIIGSRRVFELEQRRLGTQVDLSTVDDSIAAPARFRMGSAQKDCGRAAFEALEAGCEMLETGRISALVTAPVSKEALRTAGFAWPGQTEFLADRLGAKRHAMLAWTPSFKAVFVTIHLPLAEVPRHITAGAVLEKTVLLDEFLRREAGDVKRAASLRIAVLALNPHGAEFSLGEEARIAEGVRRARRAGINAVGPVPADAAMAGECGGYVAMYHDQAMIPAKLLGRDSGVNVTLGLPYVRTSPLHGTAFDIAGRGVARADSMRAAIALAVHLAGQ